MPLRELLTEACMTQAGIAEASGVHIATVERLVNGHNQPTLATARVICEVLSEALRRPVTVDEAFPPRDVVPTDSEGAE